MNPSTTVDDQPHSITIVLVTVVMLLFSASCSHRGDGFINAIDDRDTLPAVETHDVSTIISDSGVIRYKVTSPLWLIYDRRDPSYWAFEQGVYLENYDDSHQVQASIQSDTAYYYDAKRLWELKGDVHIENVKGEIFDTQLLYWDQGKQRVYSDQFIRIQQTDRIITGQGFDSNQQFTAYTIHQPGGIFYVKDEAQAQPASSDTLLVTSDTLSVSTAKPAE